MNKQTFDEQSQRPAIDDATVDAEAGIESLLRELGSRDEPAPEITAAIRHAVHAEWQSVVAQQAQRRRTMTYGIAASVATAVFALAVVLKFTAAPVIDSVTVASIAKAEGLLQVGDGQTWRDIGVGEQLATGQVLRTGHAARASLDYSKLSVRIDENSIVKLVAVDRVMLESGRVYVDAQTGQQVPLTIETQFGEFEHVGTQYQVQYAGDKSVLSVREGRVLVAPNKQVGQRVEAVAGERLEIGVQGELARTALLPHDESWQWALQVAPAFEIENQSLARFLEWAARETGRSVHYVTPAVRQQAEQLILRGSVNALTPEQALTAVMATTGFVFVNRESTIEISL
jgi:hypothetical protein